LHHFRRFYHSFSQAALVHQGRESRIAQSMMPTIEYLREMAEKWSMTEKW
jgi:hypothetical protein